MELTLESALSAGGLVGNASYLLLILSMAMRDMFWLRLLAVFSGIAGVSYDVIWLSDPVGAFWESLFTLVNLVQWLWLIYEKRRANLTPEQSRLRDQIFPLLSNSEFLKLQMLATQEHFSASQVMIQEGDPVIRLYLITQGEAEVSVGGSRLFICQAGDFLGEIGFLNRIPASATVTASTSVQCLGFDCAAMRRVIDANPNLERGITLAMNANLASKIMRNNVSGLMAGSL